MLTYDDGPYLSPSDPRLLAEVVEPFFGYISDDSFVLWSTFSTNIKLDVTLEAIPDGTIIIITSDIRNLALSTSAMAIGLSLPAIAGFATGAIVASSWVCAAIATIVATWMLLYVKSIHQRLADWFERDVETLLGVVDPDGRRDNSDAVDDSLGDDPEDLSIT